MKDELFELDGEKYENCRKKGYTARTKHDNRPWWTTDYTILFSKIKNTICHHNMLTKMTDLEKPSRQNMGMKNYHLAFTIDRF